MQVQISRDDAWDLLCEWTESESLRRHMLAVEAAMRAYAPRFDGDVELWGLTGLLHDLDYERYPNLDDGHPRYAIRELEARGYPPEVVRAVASHADFLGVSRDTPMEKTLYAVDELCGFVLACAYVRPEGLVGMTPKSVKKKLKQPSFAAAVNREEVQLGAEELGVDFDEHLAIVIGALQERREALLGES
jgi:putative nucleotidyltransferase with HDIG domain